MADRKNINFQKLVLRNYQFLINKYNFKIEDSDLYYIKATNGKIYFEFYHDRISYEMDIVIGDVDKNVYININDLFTYENIESNLAESFCAISKSLIEKYLYETSKIIRKFCKNKYLFDVKNIGAV